MEACWAHNPEVRGSKPRSARFFFKLLIFQVTITYVLSQSRYLSDVQLYLRVPFMSYIRLMHTDRLTTKQVNVMLVQCSVSVSMQHVGIYCIDRSVTQLFTSIS